MENKPRFLTVCSSALNFPQVFVQGRWLEEYGFEVGAQVTLTNPKSGMLVMKQTRSAKEHQENRERVNLQKRLATLEQMNAENKKEMLSIQKELKTT